MHTAYYCVPILDKLPVKIECLASWGTDLLLIGSSDGHLLVYEVLKRNAEEFDVRVLDSIKGFGKKAVTQLTVLSRSNLLLSLSDGNVTIHDIGLQQQQPQQRAPVISVRTQLTKAKQATLYAIDTSTPEYRLVVATQRKRLHFYRLVPGSKEFEELGEKPTPDVPRCLMWAGPRLCIGYKKEYVMFDVRTGNTQELFETGKSGNPIATVMPNQQMLLNKDNISIFLGYDGKPTRKYGIAWNDAPIDFGYAFPYVIGLLPSGVELRTLTNPNTVQMIRICKGATRLAVGDDQIYCASQSLVWRLEPVPIAEQVAQLVSENEFGEALNLLDCLPDSNEKTEKKRAINLNYAFHLFHLGQHEAALEKFVSLKEDPLHVLGLYPSMLPNGVIDKHKFKYPYGVGLNDAKLENANRALAVYLQKVRLDYQEQIMNADAQEVPQDYHQCGHLVSVIIDTCLLRSLLRAEHPFLMELVTSPNACHIPVCEAALSSARRFKELVALYKTRRIHRKALELLRTLGKDSAAGDMKGAGPTVTYLKTLTNKDQDLILEFSVWILELDTELGLTVFTVARKAEDKLDASTVLKHLNKYAHTEVPEYLEHVIDGGETDPAFHNELVFTYLKSIQLILEFPTSSSSSSSSITTAPAVKGPVRPPKKASDEIGLLGVYRKKLLRFLESSKYYHAERMLSRFPANDLYEERAILFTRIGRFSQALQIYAHKLEDTDMAEAYCEKHYKQQPDIYLTLLQVYLTPSEPEKKVMEAPALLLLNRYYDRMDTSKAIQLLPATIPVKKLEPFFISVLQRNDRIEREHHMQRSLLRFEALSVQEEWFKARGKRIKITDKLMCPICQKRIGKDVTFVVLPDSTVMHYACWQH